MISNNAKQQLKLVYCFLFTQSYINIIFYLYPELIIIFTYVGYNRYTEKQIMIPTLINYEKRQRYNIVYLDICFLSVYNLYSYFIKMFNPKES